MIRTPHPPSFGREAIPEGDERMELAQEIEKQLGYDPEFEKLRLDTFQIAERLDTRRQIESQRIIASIQVIQSTIENARLSTRSIENKVEELSKLREKLWRLLFEKYGESVREGFARIDEKAGHLRQEIAAINKERKTPLFDAEEMDVIEDVLEHLQFPEDPEDRKAKSLYKIAGGRPSVDPRTDHLLKKLDALPVRRGDSEQIAILQRLRELVAKDAGAVDPVSAATYQLEVRKKRPYDKQWKEVKGGMRMFGFFALAALAVLSSLVDLKKKKLSVLTLAYIGGALAVGGLLGKKNEIAPYLFDPRYENIASRNNIKGKEWARIIGAIQTDGKEQAIQFTSKSQAISREQFIDAIGNILPRGARSLTAFKDFKKMNDEDLQVFVQQILRGTPRQKENALVFVEQGKERFATALKGLSSPPSPSS